MTGGGGLVAAAPGTILPYANLYWPPYHTRHTQYDIQTYKTDAWVWWTAPDPKLKSTKNAGKISISMRNGKMSQNATQFQMQCYFSNSINYSRCWKAYKTIEIRPILSNRVKAAIQSYFKQKKVMRDIKKCQTNNVAVKCETDTISLKVHVTLHENLFYSLS